MQYIIFKKSSLLSNLFAILPGLVPSDTAHREQELFVGTAASTVAGKADMVAAQVGRKDTAAQVGRRDTAQADEEW